MNKERRNAIDSLTSRLQDLMYELDDIREQEQNALDNMPESLQESERGEKMQEAIDAMEEASSYIGDAIDNLLGITE